MQLNAPPVRWEDLKCLLRKEKKWLTYFLLLIIQKALSLPILMRAEWLKPQSSRLCWGKQGASPSLGPISRAGQAFLWSYILFFTLLISEFSCFSVTCRCLFTKASSSFFAKDQSFEPPFCMLDQWRCPERNCLLRMRHAFVSHWWDVLLASQVSFLQEQN